MTDVVSALQDATAQLLAACQLMQLISAQRQTDANNAKSAAQAVVNQVLTVASINMYVDPINGVDTNDGLTLATAKKTLDAMAATMTGPRGVQCLLFGDDTFRQRQHIKGPLGIFGVQQANNAYGYAPATHTISFLGTALNSPIGGPVGGSTVSAGLFVDGLSLTTNNCNFSLPDQPAGQNFSEHFQSSAAFFSILEPVISATANAGALIGCENGRITVYMDPTLSSGTAGHLFRGVAAGQNPNSQFVYVSNLTSA